MEIRVANDHGLLADDPRWSVIIETREHMIHRVATGFTTPLDAQRSLLRFLTALGELLTLDQPVTEEEFAELEAVHSQDVPDHSHGTIGPAHWHRSWPPTDENAVANGPTETRSRCGG